MISIEPKSRPEITAICKIAGQMLKKYSRGCNNANSAQKTNLPSVQTKDDNDNILNSAERESSSGGSARRKTEPIQEPAVLLGEFDLKNLVQ